MRTIILTIIFLGAHVFCYSQTVHQMNLIITVDNNVITNADMVKVVIEKQSGNDTSNAYYTPGRLNIVKDYAEMVNDKVKSIVIDFTYVQYYNKKMKKYRYQIRLSAIAISQDFNIINIFNLDKPENGKVFYPVKGQNYVYDYIYPGGGMLTRRI
jgi:hypothetical protein